jgi:hypothetical protein
MHTFNCAVNHQECDDSFKLPSRALLHERLESWAGQIRRRSVEQVLKYTMADPLSVAASVLTVVGAATKIAVTLERLWCLRDAPDVVQAIMNEVCLHLTVLKGVDIELLTLGHRSHGAFPRSGKLNGMFASRRVVFAGCAYCHPKIGRPSCEDAERA